MLSSNTPVSPTANIITLPNGKRQRIEQHNVPRTAMSPFLQRAPVTSLYQSIQCRSMFGNRLFGRKIHYSGRSILDRYRCHDNQVYYFYFPDYTSCLPYSVDYSHSAMGGNLLAVPDEDGRVSIMRTDKSNEPSQSEFHCTFHCHGDAATDAKWSMDDTMLLTSGGDYTIRIMDVEQHSCLAAFSGHKGVIRAANWHPTNPHLIVSACRAGAFNLWDTRCRQIGISTDEKFQSHVLNFVEFDAYPVYGPVRAVEDAHVEKGKTSRKGKISAPRTVTCALFYGQDEEKVLTSGSLDGMVKLWDCRAGRTSRPIETTVYKDKQGVTKGIADMKLDQSGTRLFSLCMDDSVYMHYLVDITKPARRYTDPAFKAGFSSTLSLSHDDQFLLAGSNHNQLFCWDIEGDLKQAHRFDGHTDAVTGVAWHHQSNNEFASCGNDHRVRIFKKDK
ncbi:WD40 repeat-like protein [Hesseltinella vesiculosa]|uniref:WD40 repeat-like protein n=1 Tax=Hesseltinella vesiculosa TaxID=101127 RepID=A0A1X2GMD3_9FUNG|nr:WD40 repeat-like protein [Hesseltinella vesiculosa]